jgi:hypothetical protein
MHIFRIAVKTALLDPVVLHSSVVFAGTAGEEEWWWYPVELIALH